jgi:hypothetical protein
MMSIRNRQHVWVLLYLSIGVSVDASRDVSNLRGLAKKVTDNSTHRKLGSLGACEVGCETHLQCDVSTADSISSSDAACFGDDLGQAHVMHSFETFSIFSARLELLRSIGFSRVFARSHCLPRGRYDDCCRWCWVLLCA